jgi:hypothetical protein
VLIPQTSLLIIHNDSAINSCETKQEIYRYVSRIAQTHSDEDVTKTMTVYSTGS